MARGSESGYGQYLLEHERRVFATHRHWMMLARPVLFVLLSVTLAGALLLTPNRGLLTVGLLSLWGVFAAVVYLVWQAVERTQEWFIATDKRLVLAQGLLHKNVGTMPMVKVTDLSYIRTIPGRIFGYGKFVLESAGQNQAMREINWIPRPDTYYRLVSAEMHKLAADTRDLPYRAEGDSPGAPPGATSGEPPGMPPEPPRYPATDDYSRPLPIAGRGAPAAGESIYRSPDLQARDRSADTVVTPIYGDPGWDEAGIRAWEAGFYDEYGPVED